MPLLDLSDQSVITRYSIPCFNPSPIITICLPSGRIIKQTGVVILLNFACIICQISAEMMYPVGRCYLSTPNDPQCLLQMPESSPSYSSLLLKCGFNSFQSVYFPSDMGQDNQERSFLSLKEKNTKYKNFEFDQQGFQGKILTQRGKCYK